MLILFITILFIVGIFLLVRGVQLRIRSIFPLPFAFILIFIGFVGRYFLSLGEIFEEICVSSGFILVGYFTYLNFHKGRVSHSKKLFLVIVFLGFLNIILRALDTHFSNVFTYYIAQSNDVLITFIVFFWLGNSSFRVYNILKDKNIKPWVKRRYLFLSFAGFLLSIQALPELIAPPRISYGGRNVIVDVLFGITTVITFISSILMMLAWIFPSYITSGKPKKEKNELDRETLSEEKIMQKIKEEIQESNSTKISQKGGDQIV